jgi:hypothetical protein
LLPVESPNARSDIKGKATMLRTINQHGAPFAHDPALRGYHAAYRENQVNHCPGCGRSHWYVGRMSAECGFCGTALPLAGASMTGIGGLFRSHPPLQIARAA